MNNAEIMQSIEKAQERETTFSFNVGDTVKVSALIKEGNRERIQAFEGTVIKIQGTGLERLSQLERTLTV